MNDLASGQVWSLYVKYQRWAWARHKENLFLFFLLADGIMLNVIRLYSWGITAFQTLQRGLCQLKGVLPALLTLPPAPSSFLSPCLQSEFIWVKHCVYVTHYLWFLRDACSVNGRTYEWIGFCHYFALVWKEQGGDFLCKTQQFIWPTILAPCQQIFPVECSVKTSPAFGTALSFLFPVTFGGKVMEKMS